MIILWSLQKENWLWPTRFRTRALHMRSPYRAFSAYRNQEIKSGFVPFKFVAPEMEIRAPGWLFSHILATVLQSFSAVLGTQETTNHLRHQMRKLAKAP